MSHMVCTSHQMFGWYNPDEWGGRSICYLRCLWRRAELRVLVGKPEGKRSLGRTRHRWKVNSKLDLQ